MQVLYTPEATGWPAILTLNSASAWEKELLQVLAFRIDALGELVLDGCRLHITLEPKHVDAPDVMKPEPTVPIPPPPKDATEPGPGESAADPTG